MSHRQARAELNGTTQFTIAPRKIRRGERRVGITKCSASFGKVFIDCEGSARGLFRLASAFDGSNVAARSKTYIGVSQARVGKRIIVIFLNRLLEIAICREHIFAGATLGIRPALHVISESFDILGGALREMLPLGASQLQAEL